MRTPSGVFFQSSVVEAVNKYQTILSPVTHNILPSMSTDDIESFLVKAVEKEQSVQ